MKYKKNYLRLWTEWEFWTLCPRWKRWLWERGHILFFSRFRTNKDESKLGDKREAHFYGNGPWKTMTTKCHPFSITTLANPDWSMVKANIIIKSCFFLVELSIFTAVKCLLYIWTVYFLMASTFKSDDSLSSTDDIRTNPKLSNDKSESEVVSKAPKTSSSQPASLPVITFSFTQLSTANVCFTEQILLAAKLNAGCKICWVWGKEGSLIIRLSNVDRGN